MSSTICQNFVQNAWKKELCSNCFKSKDEHIESKPKPITLISSDCISGIIKNTNKIRPKRSVAFKNDLLEIIGYGGEDWNYEIDQTIEDRDISDEEISNETDEETQKELRRITKENTDFNAMNLKCDIESNKTVNNTQLMLGKPLIDSSGKKQTLVVSITPFGQDIDQTKRLTKIAPMKNKESLSDTKSNVILMSYTKNNENTNVKEEKSLLDEISETLQNSINPIQIMSKKKTHKEIVSMFNDYNKENITKNEENSDKSTKVLPQERKINLTRTPALKKDKDKPVVYQTSTAKIELKIGKNIRSPAGILTKENPDIAPKSPVDIPPIEPPIFLKELESEIKVDTIENKDEEPICPHSREQAGEPDGRADEDSLTEPPALPLTPPPALELQNSFLHNDVLYDKPKLPLKPVKDFPLPLRKIDDYDIAPIKLIEQDSISSDISAKTAAANKRKAPKPPELELVERQERATSCNPSKKPEIMPRKNLSVSTDNLEIGCGDEKRKTKGRFSLKKFLRMGSAKDLHKEPLSLSVVDGNLPPLPKPRLVIVHPTELNGTDVQVLSKPAENHQNNWQSGDYETFQKTKPPPPPRNFSINSPKRHPKSAQVLLKQTETPLKNNIKKPETIYANIGEVRSAIVPNKPQRTASMREREALQQKQNSNENYEDRENVYDYINSARSSSPDSDSSPNKNSPISKTVRLNKRSESSIDVSGEYFKYSIPRSMSLTYCGSETESEIYSPYSFYGSESEVTEEDDWNQNGRVHKLRSRKGRSIVHKNLEDNYGAVIAANHEALAQVLENILQITHIQPALRGLKALTNLRWTDFTIKTSSQPISVGCRTFHQALWGTQHVTLAVHASAVPANTVSLSTFNLISITEFSDLIPKNYLYPDKEDEKDIQIQATISVFPWLQVNTIESYSELLRKSSQTPEEISKDACFVMLQLINAMKTLQAQGIEELSLSLNSFILCKEVDKGTHQKLYVLQSLGEENHPKAPQDKYGTLCTCACKALMLFPPITKVTTLLQSLLSNERAVTLTQVKSILEFYLWGPSDVILGNTIHDRELALQRWLDLQRATVLHGLVCTRIQLSVYEENHLLFLVRSSSRMMCDASLLLESSSFKPVIRNK